MVLVRDSGATARKLFTTKAEIRVDICAECHPYFTGAQKFVDTAGRVDKFLKRYGKPKEGAKA